VNDDEGVKFLERAYGANNNQELEACYDEWAERYEADVCGYGYMSPVITSGLIGRYVKPQDGVVLDAGAGTGTWRLLICRKACWIWLARRTCTRTFVK